MTGDLKEAAAQAIVDAIKVLDRVYRHGEQILNVLSAKLQSELRLDRGGSIGEYKGDGEGKVRLPRFRGFYLARDRDAWKSAQLKAEALAKPILFACLVSKPPSPELVGGMVVLCGVLWDFRIKPQRALKGYKPDQYLPFAIEEVLREQIADAGHQPTAKEILTKHMSLQGSYLTARLVDLPDESTVVGLAERLVKLWKSK